MEVVGYVPGYVKGTCKRGSNLWSPTALLTMLLTSGNALRWPGNEHLGKVVSLPGHKDVTVFYVPLRAGGCHLVPRVARS